MSTPSDDPAAELAAAADRLERLESDPPVDPEDVDTVADAYESVARVLDRWEERATDWDDFEGYVEFRDDLSDTMSSIPEDAPESEAFLEADGHVKTSGVSKSLTADDFEAAREALAPAREYADYRDDLEDARSRYRTAYRQAERRRRELDERIEELQRVRRLGEADLDAPVERLREPIERYDEAVREAFAEFRKEAPAREFLGFVRTAAGYPLVDFRAPPTELFEYVDGEPAGDHTVPELLEYADYSKSKLEHYVEDASLLKRRVATNRTYLEDLSADPLCIGWPPPEVGRLRFRTEELLSVVDRFAGEETTRALRAVCSLARDDEYERLRESAVARAELTPEERERLRSGAVAEELESARDRRERLDEALEEHDPP
jgi:hypothetical protein